MKEFLTENRKNKIDSVLKARQFSLRVVIENVHDPHNVSAVFRTCDAAGIPKISLIYNKEKFPKIAKTSSASAFKWVDKEKFRSVDECYESLRKEGFQILATSLTAESVNLYDVDFTKKTAVVLGNEHRGVSEEAEQKADRCLYIPQFGMVQSLNISVANAVIVYEALRQRKAAGLYDDTELDIQTYEAILDEWYKK